MADINEMLKKSYETLNELQLKLEELNQVHDDIISLKNAAIKGNDFSLTIPLEFQKKFDEVKLLSQKYLTDIDAATNKYFEINNKVYLDNQNLFVNHIRDLQSKNTELQSKIDSLKIQIERLEKIDLETHFNNLQKTLGEIFVAINAINLTITNIVTTLTGIVQSLGNIQTTLDTNHKEAKQLLNNFSEANEKHLADQDKQTTKNVELLESKMKFLSEQNELLKKEVKINRIIQIVGLTIILIILIYVAVTKH